MKQETYQAVCELLEREHPKWHHIKEFGDVREGVINFWHEPFNGGTIE